MNEEAAVPTEDRDQPRSILKSAVWQRPEAKAHAELVWDADVAKLEPLAAPVSDAATIEDLSVSEAWAQEAAAAASVHTGPVGALAGSEHAPADDALAPADDALAGADDALAGEIARRRDEELERLDAEMAARRAELARSLERQRAEAEERIAAAERAERTAMARVREEEERLWAVTQPSMLAERINGALAAELGDVRQRHAQAEARMREQVDARRRDEMARLEAWRSSERVRIEAELGAEERRFNERLMRQLQEFEFQLGERLREQEERLARCWDDVEKRARQGLASLVDEALSAEPPAGDGKSSPA